MMYLKIINNMSQSGYPDEGVVEKLSELQEEHDRLVTENEELEKQLRHERYKLALRQTIEKYPQLEEAIKRSLQTPQLGPHHNEGPRMDAHLELIIGTLYDICDGRIADDIPEEIRELIIDTVVIEAPPGSGRKVPNPELVEYAFLHDISKPDCMSLEVEGREGKIEITWSEWLEIEAGSEPYRLKVKKLDENGQELEEELEIKSFSYYQESRKDEGKHGNAGAEFIIAQGADVSPEVLQAMRLHEVAYQFVKIKGVTYEEHFVKPGFSEHQRNMIITASYIDLMASLSLDGSPDLDSLVYLIHSRANLRLINQSLEEGAIIPENKIGKLKKSDRILTLEDIKEADQRKQYDLDKLRSGLSKLVEDGSLTTTQQERIIEIVQTEEVPLAVLGPELGRQMALIRPYLIED